MLDNLRATAGQRRHEIMYSARLKIFDVEIPCVHSELHKNFQLMEGGRSCMNFVEAVTFLAANIPEGSTPAKEVNIELQPANTAGFTLLKLGIGSLLPDGLTWRFMAYDRNYAA